MNETNEEYVLAGPSKALDIFLVELPDICAKILSLFDPLMGYLDKDISFLAKSLIFLFLALPLVAVGIFFLFPTALLTYLILTYGVGAEVGFISFFVVAIIQGYYRTHYFGKPIIGQDTTKQTDD